MKKLRGAVVGYGFISSQGHIPAYLGRSRDRDDVEIVAVADICELRRNLIHQALPDARIYGDYQSLITNEAHQLDFIDIATPPRDHAPIALFALDAGLHVLCEKPLAPTLQEVRAMLRKAQEKRRVIFPCHNYKHAPVIQEIQTILESGRIGTVRSVCLNTFRNTHAQGVLEWNPHWRRDSSIAGGGIAMDHGSHSFYLTFSWLKSYPISVTAQMTRLEPSVYDTEDQLSCVLMFPEGLAQCYLTWTAGVRKVLYSIHGDRGAITVDDDEIQIAEMNTSDHRSSAQEKLNWNIEKKSIASHWMDASHVGWFSSLFDDFKSAIERNEYVGQEALEAFLCTHVIVNAYRSAREGCREISLKPDCSSFLE